MNENDNNGNRNDLINTAVKFLNNSNIQKASDKSKRAFLKKKGLTDDEIQCAFNRAIPKSQQSPPISHTAIQMPSEGTLQVHPYYPISTHASWWWKIREILHSIALISGVAYALYWFYKKYIYPYLFGKPKDKSPLDKLVDIENSLSKNVNEVKTQVNQVKQKLDQMESLADHNMTMKQLNDLKMEISSVKGLLLNRKQFPLAYMAPQALGQPSIPSWQLTDPEKILQSPSKSDEPEDSKSTNSNGSNEGSDTSPEIIPNGSDSSLEIVRDNTQLEK